MSDLKLSLELFHLFVKFFKLWITCELFGYVEWDQKFCKVGSLFQRGQIFQQIVVNGIDNLSVTIEESIFPISTKIRFVGKNLQELGNLENDLLGLCLSGIDVDIRVKILEDFEYKISECESR